MCVCPYRVCVCSSHWLLSCDLLPFFSVPLLSYLAISPSDGKFQCQGQIVNNAPGPPSDCAAPAAAILSRCAAALFHHTHHPRKEALRHAGLFLLSVALLFIAIVIRSVHCSVKVDHSIGASVAEVPPGGHGTSAAGRHRRRRRRGQTEREAPQPQGVVVVLGSAAGRKRRPLGGDR